MVMRLCAVVPFLEFVNKLNILNAGGDFYQLCKLYFAEINECESKPCANGTCVDGIGGYTCQCQSGYTGDQCDLGECYIV